ncbi:DUF2487 family protein [Salirhabdus sp. Marseille-P4669]|uniref:DUF2487 family protein n=1 Tax=Salirhabdus sp. Marseille-P4669 TaxID=2042310 RepID=UPI000C79B772|nr:DUF2487 family protein [Salirhabdus sp. Marseille-P4669]
MKWTKQDVSVYVTSKEYIDTAFIPLVPFTLNQSDDELTSLAFQKEVIEVLCRQIEQEFAGRSMLFPTYVYGQSSDRESEVTRLNAFSKQIQEKPFKYVFFVTFDSHWKKDEGKLEGNLIWMPVMKDGDLQSNETQKVIMDQVQQMKELVRLYWS